MPQNEAGRITEPPVWVPSASGNMKSAMPAAEPDEEPPGVCPVLCGLRVGPGWVEAISVVTVLPMMMPWASRSDLTQAASRFGLAPLEELAAVLRRHVGGVDDVLDADRQAVQRADTAP